MRFLFLLVAVALASAEASASAAMIQDTAGVSSFNTLAGGSQIQRSLRGFLAQDEERGAGGVKLESILTAFVQKARAKLPPGFTVAALANWKGVGRRVDDVMQHYPKGLSDKALDELRAAETKRFQDWALFGKADKATLLRPMEGIDESKIAPKLSSLVGRENAVFGGQAPGRNVVCNVVMRPEKEGGGILLISSSKLEKQDFILPKGGLEKGESHIEAATREVLEEGGVAVKRMENLGSTRVGDKTYESFLMKRKTIYEQWSESRRLRVWLSWDDAITLLTANGHDEMVEIVKQAREVAKQAAAAKAAARAA